MYMSTRIYEFSMKCHLCHELIVIKADPEITDYVVLKGAYKINQDWDPKKDGGIVVRSEKEQKKLKEDPFFALENSTADMEVKKSQAPRLAKLQRVKEVYEDDFQINSDMRRTFREDRRERVETQRRVKNFGLRLLPRANIDRDLAKAVDFKSSSKADQKTKKKLTEIRHESIFQNGDYGVSKREDKKKVQLHQKLNKMSTQARNQLKKNKNQMKRQRALHTVRQNMKR